MMELNNALKHVSVIGAAGKMGRGIAFLLLQEMVRLKREAKEGESFCLRMIDVNDQALHSLREDLRNQLKKYAEKQINALRLSYADDPGLVSNEEIINAYVENALDIVQYDTDFESSKHSTLIFEAIVENFDVKAKVLENIAKNNPEVYFFSNTSSIPISALNEKASLGNKIIGFHFYNPPVVQKLVELIVPKSTEGDFRSLAIELAGRLHKKIIFSADIAGFIGNGQFIRELLFACQKVHELEREFSLIESIYLVNRTTKDWLIRPMGTFQLMDYVGLDVCQKICKTMQTYLHGENFHDDLIDAMNDVGAIGGQYSNGFQKNGFFQYEKNIPVGIYSLQDQQYHLFEQEKWKDRVDAFLGPLPEKYISWKDLQKDPEKDQKLAAYFTSLFESGVFGADLAEVFLVKAREIAHKLVESHVAGSLEDVNAVMMNGFYHLYGPENPWLRHNTHAISR